MRKFFALIVFVGVAFSAFLFWPEESKAECRTYEQDTSLAYSGVEGLSYKYVDASRFLLFVSIFGEQHLPETLHRDNVTKIAKEYLSKRMLPCTGHKEVEVIEYFHDKRMQEDNVLIAYVDVKFLDAIPKSANAERGYRPNMAMFRSGYYRAPPYDRPENKKPQMFDSKVDFLSLDLGNEKINELVEPFIKRTLQPTWRYYGAK